MTERILQDIRERLGFDQNDTSYDDEILKMPPDTQFELWCKYNGLLGGWHAKIRDVVLELFREEE